MSACPDALHLHQFHLENLSEGDRELMLGHVRTCTACQQDLAQLMRSTTGAAVQPPTPVRRQFQRPAPLPADHLLRNSATNVESAPEGNGQRPSIPNYEILGELGRGGMGVVYKARQTQLNRLVALKMILNGGHATDKTLARFQAEAAAIAKLQHPNIVQIYDIGVWPASTGGPPLPYFSLEFCAGGSLGNQLAGLPQPARASAELIEKIARAMQLAHDQHIVHRDLKPDNVLLSQDHPNRTATDWTAFTPKITDFGLAKQLNTNDRLTETGAAVGTPCYMAPEQVHADNRNIGPLTDVYALGAILYEMLTGRPPFWGTSATDTMMMIVQEEPVPPSHFQRSIPRDVETICLRCLQKSPRQRYPSAKMLADDLRRYLDGEPILARRLSTWEQAVKWVRKRPTVAALLALVLLTMFVGTTGITIKWLEADAARRIADTKTHEAEQAAEAAQQAAETAKAEKRNAERALVASQLSQAQLAYRLNDVPSAEKLLNRIPVAQRHWQWNYLHQRNHREVWTTPEYDIYGWSVAFHPDGRLITGSGNPFGNTDPAKGEHQPKGNLTVWRLGQPAALNMVGGVRQVITAVALIPPENELVLALTDFHELVTYRLQPFERVINFEYAPKGNRPGEILNVAMSADGQRAFMAMRIAGLVRQFNPRTGQSTGPDLRPPNGGINVALRPDGQELAVSTTTEIRF